MEKKKGTICIVNRAIFTTDDNHPKGFTIPVNTRLIIDTIGNKYLFCTLDNGYKIGIELEHDYSLTIITDNKKINKFKQQLAENNIMQKNISNDFGNCNFKQIEDEYNRLLKKNEVLGLNTGEIKYLEELLTELNIRGGCIIPSNIIKNIDNLQQTSEAIQAPKTVIKRKVWTVEVLEFADGTSEMNRTNQGFNINELMGLSSLISLELLEQYRGNIKADVINRKVIVD